MTAHPGGAIDAVGAEIERRRHEHLWLRDLRKHPGGEVRLYDQGRLVSGTFAAQVTASVNGLIEAARDQFPRVQGRCPTCGSSSLFLGAGGYVTCSWAECSRPDHASDLLDGTPGAPR